jgi:hypothetical protein
MSGNLPTLSPEWSLLTAACSTIPNAKKLTRLQPMLQQPIGWQQLFALAERHGVQPLLYQALLPLANAVPPAEMRGLQLAYEANLHKAMRLAAELIRLDQRLSALGLEAMPYKGLAAAEILYGDIALRHSGDIDLLIHREDLPRIREAVRELGYTPHTTLSAVEEREYLRSGYEYSFDGTAGPNLLEVQWAIQPRFYAVDFDMDSLFRRAVTISVAGRPVKTPSYSDLFLLFSAHAAKHVWGRLIWLCDVARLMTLPSLDWRWIGSQASDLGIVRILRVTMLLANRLLTAPIPNAAEENLPKDRGAAELANEIQPCIFSETAFNIESLSYFRLMMRLRERPADRRRFLRRLVLTPGPSEWRTVHLPQPLFPLYRLIRLSRLAARLVSG